MAHLRARLLAASTLALAGLASPARADNPDCWTDASFAQAVAAPRRPNRDAHVLVTWRVLQKIVTRLRDPLAGKDVYFIEPFVGRGLYATELADADGKGTGLTVHEGSYLHAFRALERIAGSVTLLLDFGGKPAHAQARAVNAACLLSRGDVAQDGVPRWLPSFVGIPGDPERAWEALRKIPGVATTLRGDDDHKVVRVVYVHPRDVRLTTPPSLETALRGAIESGRPYVFVVDTPMRWNASATTMDWSWLPGLDRKRDLKPSPDAHHARLAKAWKAFEAMRARLAAEFGADRFGRWDQGFATYDASPAEGPEHLTTIWCANFAAACASRGPLSAIDHLDYQDVPGTDSAVTSIIVTDLAGLSHEEGSFAVDRHAPYLPTE